MQTRWDTLPVGGDAMRVYVALPDGDGPFPGVAVMQGRGETVVEPRTHIEPRAGLAVQGEGVGLRDLGRRRRRR